MRKLFRLPYRTHNDFVCGSTEDISIKIHRRVTKFMYSMIHRDNLFIYFYLLTTFIKRIIHNLMCSEAQLD